MGWKKGNPGCPCCCSCELDTWVTSFIADVGSWTRNTSPRNAVTTSSNARLRSSITWTGWKAMKVTVTHSAAGEWVQLGFTKNSSYEDRVYVRVRVVSATKSLEIEYRETIAGVDALIASQSFTTTFVVTSLSATWWLIYDPDYGTIAGLVNWAGVYRNLRANTTCPDAMYGYVGTETITGTTTVSDATTRHCYSWPEGSGNSGFTDRAPHEWQLELSGVALGAQVVVCRKPPIMGGGSPCTDYNGYYDWYSYLNDTHVLPSLGGYSAQAWWQLTDQYPWTDANLNCNGAGSGQTAVAPQWRVNAYWLESTTTLISKCANYIPTGETLSPSYVGKPVLVLTVELVVDVSNGSQFTGCWPQYLWKATWAAIVQADWDSVFPDTAYFSGDEHEMTPNLFPAVCNFDWRTISQKKLTFICATDDGIDFDNSELYISAVP